MLSNECKWCSLTSCSISFGKNLQSPSSTCGLVTDVTWPKSPWKTTTFCLQLNLPRDYDHCRAYMYNVAYLFCKLAFFFWDQEYHFHQILSSPLYWHSSIFELKLIKIFPVKNTKWREGSSHMYVLLKGCDSFLK